MPREAPTTRATGLSAPIAADINSCQYVTQIDQGIDQSSFINSKVARFDQPDKLPRLYLEHSTCVTLTAEIQGSQAATIALSNVPMEVQPT
jgi:hypothetical protein